MKVTRIAQSKNLTDAKLAELNEIAYRLGAIRQAVWHEFGALKRLGLTHRKIRDEWIKTRKFDVPARLWKATLADTFADIEAYRAAAEKKAIQHIYRNIEELNERKRLAGLVKCGEWLSDNYTHRLMRGYFKHGATDVRNQIILDSNCYNWFGHEGQGWIEVMSLIAGQRIAIPLNTRQEISGTIRLLVHDNYLALHYTIDTPEEKTCGSSEIGVDRGYTEVFTDSDGERHGKGLGEILSAESDYLKAKYQRRYKLKAIAAAKPHKARNIEANNLGRQKLNERKRIHRERVKNKVFKAAHTVVDKASEIVSEDLSQPSKPKNRGANQNRRLAGWVKGIILYALLSVSHRRRASVHKVNAAYTSQVCHVCGHFGERQGESLYCSYCKVVWDADLNAARCVQARRRDAEIRLWTPYKRVKSILLARASPAVGTAQPGHELLSASAELSTVSEVLDYV